MCGENMDKIILDQLAIDVTKLPGIVAGKSTPKNPSVFEAEFDEGSTIDSNKSALLQVNIGEKGTESAQLAAALELVSKKFKAVTIFIDLELTLLVYSIIMPYLNKEQLQDILERKKLAWVTANMSVISSITIPWSIITDKEPSVAEAKNNNTSELKELLKNNKEFHKQVQKDAEHLKAFLANNNGINSAHYNLAQAKNDTAIQNYLLAKIAVIKAMRSFNQNEYIYVAPSGMLSYNFLQEEKLQDLPPYLTLELTKIADSDTQELLTSTELNQKIHESDFLSKISDRKCYLEHSVKNFPGTVYLQSLNHTILSCNEQQALTLGVSDKSYIANKNLTDLINKDDVNAMTKTAQEVITTANTKVLTESCVFLGKKCTFLSIKSPLRNKKNKIIGIIGFSTQIDTKEKPEDMGHQKPEDIALNIVENIDTTANKQAPYDIASLQKTIAQMPGHVFWQDTSGKILGCNNYQAAFLGFDNPNQLLGKHPSDFLTADYAKEAEQHLKEIAATGNPLIKEEVYKAADGFVVMTSHKTPIKDNNGKVVGIMVIAFDVSGSRPNTIKLEQEKEQIEIANKLKNQFMQDIEQDLRTPFMNLRNMTESYALQEQDKAKKKQLDEILNGTKELITQCDTVLEANKSLALSNNTSLISIKELVHALSTKTLELEYDESIPGQLIGDSYSFMRILNTIMINASKLAIKLEPSTKNEATISFTATGSSINDLKEIKRFTQDLNGTITNDYDNSITVTLNYAIPKGHAATRESNE